MTNRTGTQTGAVSRVKTASKTRLAPSPEDLFPTFTHRDSKPPFPCSLERGLPSIPSQGYSNFGIHAGPVVFQEGDYFGRTVNVAARIADYGRPGEALVSQEVVDAASKTQLRFDEIGPVDLKGVAGSV